MEAITLNKVSIAEYLSISRKHDQKYEFHDGSVFAMAGVTLNHVIVGSNFLGLIGAKLALKNPKYITLSSNVRLYIEAGNRIVYPDIMVINEIERLKADKETIVNPTVIVEVLSESNESYDRGDKFYFYRQIPSLKEYILVAQDKMEVDVFVRGENDLWNIKRYVAADKILKIDSIDVEILIEKIYRNVTFEVS